MKPPDGGASNWHTKACSIHDRVACAPDMVPAIQECPAGFNCSQSEIGPPVWGFCMQQWHRAMTTLVEACTTAESPSTFSQLQEYMAEVVQAMGLHCASTVKVYLGTGFRLHMRHAKATADSGGPQRSLIALCTLRLLCADTGMLTCGEHRRMKPRSNLTQSLRASRHSQLPSASELVLVVPQRHVNGRCWNSYMNGSKLADIVDNNWTQEILQRHGLPPVHHWRNVIVRLLHMYFSVNFAVLSHYPGPA